ncbi:hypothetical protein [Paenibacillus xylaniclasticus]|uniref:hypothetical protein n=1 Tax=Paenibacillus xylaniclasticus TaxID=588083 RepID=UPI000FD718F9|nr:MULTISPECIES: hypothetical protein [Paenibacillus]GFN33363.1 hypothetical protein PCURB6_36230 [Paenibacillus curdlanolyticus]
MALTEDTIIDIDTEPSAEELAIWAAALVVAADVLALIALLKARKESQQKDEENEQSSRRAKPKPRHPRFNRFKAR